MSPTLGKPLDELVQDLRERAWDAAMRVTRAGIDADDIQEEITRRLHAVRGFRGTEAQQILDILDGRTPTDTAPAYHDCVSRANNGLHCRYLQRNHPEVHGAHDADGAYHEWK